MDKIFLYITIKIKVALDGHKADLRDCTVGVCGY